MKLKKQGSPPGASPSPISMKTATIYLGEDGNIVLDSDGKPILTTTNNVEMMYAYFAKT